ncbi:protein of unknown function [Kyrpidia spormannii]|uniref:Uncharacterized protein n=1 Tax=Kyrpidia spormannii TaxID=2055160 RepID=A0ACA8Z6C2_9BACL|nr:protein of unknown function [Kyrpidia spormannii]
MSPLYPTTYGEKGEQCGRGSYLFQLLAHIPGQRGTDGEIDSRVLARGILVLIITS